MEITPFACGYAPAVDRGFLFCYTGLHRERSFSSEYITEKMNKNADQEFVEFVVKSLVNVPDDVSTVRTVDEMGVLLTLKVNPSDMGVVIGKQGQTARALRTLLRVVGAKNNARVNLKIEEPEGSTRMPRPDRSQSVDDVVDNLKL